MDVEREVLDLYRCAVAKMHVGEIHEATVTGVSAAGAFVDIEDPFLSGLLRMGGPIAGEGTAEWQVDELGISCTHTVTGATFTLGETITVEISDVAMARRTVYFRLPEEARERLRKAMRSKSKGGHKDHKGSKKGRGKGGRR